jgi:HD superfamily phosphohydrolase YqeK
MIDMGVVPAVTQYVGDMLSKEGFRHISAVVANCKMLVAQLENPDNLDVDALIIAGYLHDISTVAHGFHNHHFKSAEMAGEFLQELDVPAERIRKVEQAILAHTTPLSADEREKTPLEGRILYDADKLGRLSGLAVVTSLIEFGARYPDRAVTGEVLAAILRHIEERFIELYQSLHTAPAREMARIKFSNTLAFLDGVIEHLSEATPV